VTIGPARDEDAVVHSSGRTDGAADWTRSDEWELAARQLRAIAAFHHARAIAAWAAAAGARSRVARGQDARQLEVLRRKHQAVIARAHEQLRASGVRQAAALRHRRVVLADCRVDDGLVGGLERHGIRVVAHVPNGADAVGITVVEQPDVVVVTEPLEMVAIDEVVRDVRRYSPETGIMALAVTPERARACTDAGATLVLSGAVATDVLVGQLLHQPEQRTPGRT
jgi:hypothetical protein